jgi:hypothetical protein
MTFIAGKRNNIVELRPQDGTQSYLLNLLPEKYTFLSNASSMQPS